MSIFSIVGITTFFLQALVLAQSVEALRVGGGGELLSPQLLTLESAANVSHDQSGGISNEVQFESSQELTEQQIIPGRRPCPAEAVFIPRVVVANPGNPPKGGTGEGRVSYIYEIAKYETTNDQFLQFLNAVAQESDPHGLFDPRMQSEVYGGIERLYSSPPHCYRAKPNMGDKPVVFVSWLNILRFVNWLNNGQPTDPSLIESGSYDLSMGEAFYRFGERSVDADWVLPNADEWVKAAYYDPTKSGSSPYWSYATQSNFEPQPSFASLLGNFLQPGPNKVNFAAMANWSGTTSGNVVSVGSTGAQSYYGVYDMNGNVIDWTEELKCIGGLCGRMGRGGYFESPTENPHLNLVSGLSVSVGPVYEFGAATEAFKQFGFRVARLQSSSDLSGSGSIGKEDFEVLFQNFGATGFDALGIDINGDGVVDERDLFRMQEALLLQSW